MKLIELLGVAKESKDIIVRDDWTLGILYSDKLNCYVWCHRLGKMFGRMVVDNNDYTGHKRVILSPKLFQKGEWYLVSNKKTTGYIKII